MSDIERIDSRVGRMALHGVASLRAIEAAAQAGLPPFTLMARAGAAVARLALAVAPHARRVVVFAGPGNNGGDGIEAAVRLHALAKPVHLVLVAAVDRLPTDAAQALHRARSAGIELHLAAEGDAVARDGTGDDCDLVIDALLGIGATRPPEGAIARAVEHIAGLAARGARVLAVDVPTGLDSDFGRADGRVVVADDTLTLLALKPGLFTAAGRDHAGRIWLAPLAPRDDAVPDAWLVGRGDASWAPARRRHAEHKGSFGDVAVVGGAAGMAGAAWLAARAAHAAGAGRVFVDLLESNADGTPHTGDVDPLRPELMLRRGWWQGDVGVLRAATVVCGCGGGAPVRAALPRLLAHVARLVLDADALNAIAADPALQALVAARRGRGLATVLTPHPLEAARLAGSDTAAVQGDRLGAARALASRYGAVVVLKGSGTVIAAPDELARIAATGNASLASAGTGDVLAGWLGGRWAASGADAFAVATRAVIEHGAAAEPERPGALRAGDLVERLYLRARA